ncbi:hypothetical protein D9M73_133630 [compost metagenome]
MHRHHASRRQQVIEQAEHRFLHLAGIFGAADQDQLVGEVNRDDRFAAAAVARRVGAEARQIDDRVIGHEAAQFRLFRPHQHGADKAAMPGKLVDHTDVDAVLGLRAPEQILDEQVLFVPQCGQEIGLQDSEMLGRHRLVGLAPPDGTFGFGITDDELVLSRPPGMRPGLDHQRPVG